MILTVESICGLESRPVMLKLRWMNCVWLLIPVLGWNAIFSSKLAHLAFEYDEAVPKWVLLTENIFRAVVMIVPLMMPLRWDSPQATIGIIVYLIGLVVYFTTWLPLVYAPDSAWSNSLAGFLAPAYTPLLWLTGIGMISNWWPYSLISFVFVGVHVGHWWQVYAVVTKK